MKRSWKVYAFWILFTEAVGALAGWLSREGTQIYNETVQKPAFSPPSIVFPIVWAVLFALMGISAARIYQRPASVLRSRSLVLYLAQLLVNFFWTLIFFNLQAFGFSFAWILLLWLLILLMILTFWRVDRAAALLQIPYFLWVSFAAFLNWSVWQLNR